MGRAGAASAFYFARSLYRFAIQTLHRPAGGHLRGVPFRSGHRAKPRRGSHQRPASPAAFSHRRRNGASDHRRRTGGMPGGACRGRSGAIKIDERDGPGNGSAGMMKKFLLCCTLILPAAAQKWTIQYFFDEMKQEMEITDLAFPSVQRGIAVGAIYERSSGREKYTALAT